MSSMTPIRMARTMYVTAEQLARFNEESIRLELNRSLNLPDMGPETRILIHEAFHHVAEESSICDGRNNVRLFLVLPGRESPVALDITSDAWFDIVSSN